MRTPTPPPNPRLWFQARVPVNGYELVQSPVWAVPKDGSDFFHQLEWHLAERARDQQFRECRPLEDSTLFRRFATLDPTDHQTLHTFANTNGLLIGQTGAILPPPHQPRSGLTWGDPNYARSDPMRSWAFWIHAMRCAMEVWELLQRDDRKRLARHLVVRSGKELKRQPVYRLPQRLEGTVAIVAPSEESWYLVDPGASEDTLVALGVSAKKIPRDQVQNAARFYLGTQVNHVLHSTLSLDYDDESQSWVVVLMPITLLDALWTQFALAVIGDVRYQACLSCGTWITISRARDGRTARARYCNQICKLRAQRRRKAPGKPPSSPRSKS